MFAVLHSDINSLKSGLLQFTGLPYCKNNRSAKVKDGIINLILRNYLVDRYRAGWERLRVENTTAHCDLELLPKKLHNTDSWGQSYKTFY